VGRAMPLRAQDADQDVLVVSGDPPELIKNAVLDRPKTLFRYLPWVFLLLIFGLAIFLSVIIGDRARGFILSKQYAFASLLAENLNHQIYRRFIMPTLVGFGQVDLSRQEQHERLDQLVEQAIHGLNVLELNIFDQSGLIAYSTNENLTGRAGLASPAVHLAMGGANTLFNLDIKVRPWQVFFNPNLEEGDIILRATHSLRAESRLAPGTAADSSMPVLGVLEFRQDITNDLLSVRGFQWSIIGITLVSCGLIFSLLFAFLRRAEQALAARAEERDRLQTRLHQNEKLAGMGRVMAGIAHEIRNPLGIIRSSAELLLRRVRNEEEKNPGSLSPDILQAIHDESLRLSKTMNDFLDYASPRAPRQESVDLGEVMDQAAAFMRSEFERRGIRLSWLPPEKSLLLTLGDKDLLYRAVYNLLSNSIQALEGRTNGEIRMEAGRTDKEIRLRIQDNGPGFALQDRRSYLEPFFTTKTGGSGLGLTLVESIIKSHHGRLELDNTDYGGALVTIFFPVAE